MANVGPHKAVIIPNSNPLSFYCEYGCNTKYGDDGFVTDSCHKHILPLQQQQPAQNVDDELRKRSSSKMSRIDQVEELLSGDLINDESRVKIRKLTSEVQTESMGYLLLSNESLQKALVQSQKALNESHHVQDLINEKLLWEGMKVQVIQASFKLYYRGIIELLLNSFLASHQIYPHNKKQFICRDIKGDQKLLDISFTDLMKHWATCEKNKGFVVVTNYPFGVQQLRADEADVFKALSGLYNKLSGQAHYCVPTSFPMLVSKFDDNADTLAMLTILNHAKINFELVASLSDAQIPENSP